MRLPEGPRQHAETLREITTPSPDRKRAMAGAAYAGSTIMRPTISMCSAWQNQLQ